MARATSNYGLRVTGYRSAGVRSLRNGVLSLWGLAFGLTLVTQSFANIVITLEARDENGDAVEGEVPARSVLQVDVLLSVDEEDDPLLDLRTVQFDFEATTASLVSRDFVWILPPGIDLDTYSQVSALPRPRLAYAFNSRQGNSIIDLDQTPVLVATLEVTVNASGSVDLRNVGADQTGEGLLLRAGFADPIDFTVEARNVSGGTLRISVAGGGGPDTDRDGVPDSADDFPFNPNETTDTDNDGVGDNGDRDDDGDGVNDVNDAFPLDPEEASDTDGDGDGDNADIDDDDDGVLDEADACPLDPGETRDSDGDGVCDNSDPDSPDDRNQGPRVTGGICGAAATASLGLTFFFWAAYRSRRVRAF